MCVRTDNKNNLKTDKFINSQLLKMRKIKEAEFSGEQPQTELDALAVITSHQRQLFEILNEKLENFHQSRYYK